MEQYLSHLEQLIEHPEAKFYADRTGKYRLRVPKHELDVTDTYRFENGFPIVTTKNVPFTSVVKELFWFLSGDTRLSTLLEHDIHIWTPDAMNRYRKRHRNDLEAQHMTQEEFEHRVLHDEAFRAEHDDMGPIYSYQWRSLPRADQIERTISSLRDAPFTSRNIVNAWNPEDVGDMALPPCHNLFQVLEYDDGFSLKMFQRSADMMLGVPFNITSYALLTHLIGEAAGKEAKGFVHTFGDDHIYGDHMPAVERQRRREPKGLPTLVMSDDIGDFMYRVLEGSVTDPLGEAASRISLEGYDPEKWIYAPLHTGLPEHLLGERDLKRRERYHERMTESHPEYAAALHSERPAAIPFKGRDYPVVYGR